tara:strand:+ start:142 stop:1188 length:1047 start_codon:yes stop_codon:yes gene_type:complete
MTVKVSKPAINVREELADLRKPSGIAGEAMLRAETPQEQFNLIGAGRRNLIINGAMQVWQRGTVFSGGGLYLADRWYSDNTGGGNSGQSTDAPNDFAYSFKANPSGSSNAVFRQAIELPAAGVGGIFRSGNSFTLSFYLKSDSAGEPINIYVASGTVVTGTTTVHVNDTATGFVTSTSWTRYTYTFECKDVGATDTCLNVVPYILSPSDYVYITGVQLELGKVATPFEHRSYGEELALCQRYYYAHVDGADQTIGAGANYSSSILTVGVNFPVTMRAEPTAIYPDVTNGFTFYRNGGNDLFDTFATVASPSLNAAFMDVTSGISGTAGHGGRVKTAAAGSYLHFKAEL